MAAIERAKRAAEEEKERERVRLEALEALRQRKLQREQEEVVRRLVFEKNEKKLKIFKCFFFFFQKCASC